MNGPGSMQARMRRGHSPGARRRRLLLAHEVGALLRLAGPIVVGQLGGVAMNTTDTIMVAPLGARALAAAGLANGLHVAVVVAIGGVLMGSTPLVSQAYGAGDRGECRRVLVQSLWLAAAVSIPVMALSLCGRALSLALGQDAAVAEIAGRFLVALAPGILPLMLFSGFRQYLDGMGRPRVAMTVLFAGVAVNVAGNFALIHGIPGVVRPLGVVGSAASTTIVRWSILAAIAAYVALHRDLSPFGRVRLAPSLARLRRIVAVGAPIGAQMGAEVACFSFAGVMMGWLGEVQLAAHNVTISLASSTFMVAVGASAAGTIRVGQHVGAGRERAVHRAAVAAYLVALGFMSCCALAFLLFPRFLLGLYTGDPQILRYGVELLFMAALFQVFDGAQVTGLSVLRGAADTRVPMIITLVGYWGVGIPVAYWLGFHTRMAHVGIWTGLTLSLAVVGVLLLWRVRRVLWGGPVAAVARGSAAEAEAAAGLEALETLPSVAGSVPSGT